MSKARERPPWKLALLAILSGALFFLISTPLPFAFLQWAAWVPLISTLNGRSFRRDFFLGWLGGAALNVAGFYWIVRTIVVFSNLPLPVALFVLGLFAAYGGLPYGLYFAVVPRARAALGHWAIFVAPTLWVALEYLFPLIFPFHQGDLQFRYLALMQIVSVTGVYGVSYLLMAANLVIFEGWESYRGRARRPLVPALVLAGLLVATLGWGAYRVWTIDKAIATSPKVRLGLIQGNFGVEDRRATQPAEVFGRYTRLSEEAANKGATLIIWGEGASPYLPGHKWERIRQLADRLDVDLITGGAGSDDSGPEVKYYNAAYGLHKGREDVDRYNKIVLLAFGEYVPFSDTFPQLKDKIEGIGDFTPGQPGSGHFVFDEPEGQVHALMMICYEAILESLVQRQVTDDTNILVNITHDAWFGKSSAPHQFLMLVTARAIEHGASVARVANTGVTCIIDPTGRIRGETPLFEQAVLVDDVTLEHFATIFQRVGNVFALACCLMTFGMMMLYLWSRYIRKKST